VNPQICTYHAICYVSRFCRALCACTALVAMLSGGVASAAYAESDAPPGRMITSLAVVINPSTHKVYAVNEDAGTVSVTDESTGASHVVKVGSGPISIAINRVTDRIYVANTGSGSISVIDGNQDTVITTIKGESHPYVLAVNEATNKVYVTNTYSDAVTVIDGPTNTAQALKAGTADGIAIDPRSNTVFLMGYEDPNIRAVNGATGAVSKVTSSTLYLAHTGTADIVALNEKTHEVKTIPVGSIPCAVAINPVTQTIYAVNYGDETVSAIDATQGKVPLCMWANIRRRWPLIRYTTAFMLRTFTATASR
jgi:YVTN family beta-propeller protein